MKSMKDLIEDILRKDIELSLAIQEFEKKLIFHRFGAEKPNATITNDKEIILEYNGLEMNLDLIIECMKEPGYITPNDFI